MFSVFILQTHIRNAAAVRAACDRLQLRQPLAGTHQMFHEEAAGLAVHLPQWRYPVVCDACSGKIFFQNCLGQWGERRHLNRFLQACAVEMCHLEARRMGNVSFNEKTRPDGSIELHAVRNGQQLATAPLLVQTNGDIRMSRISPVLMDLTGVRTWLSQLCQADTARPPSQSVTADDAD